MEIEGLAVTLNQLSFLGAGPTSNPDMIRIRTNCDEIVSMRSVTILQIGVRSVADGESSLHAFFSVSIIPNVHGWMLVTLARISRIRSMRYRAAEMESGDGNRR